LRETFECELAAFLVASGTAANALALGAITPPWGAIFCHERAHVTADECGAPEMFTGGAKIIGIGGDRGKIDVDALHEALARFKARPSGHSKPTVLSLAQANECGAIYSVAEIAALSSLAHAEGMLVHMDGARFANAVVGLGVSPAEASWKAGVDVLSLGASKNGGLACEAVLFFRPTHACDFRLQRKRSGHTVAKGRFLGAQMSAYLDEGFWLDAARHANRQAARLAAGLALVPAARLAWQPEANLVFATIPRKLDRALRASGAEYYEWPASPPVPRIGSNEVFIRLATCFATTSEEIDRFVGIAARAATSGILRSRSERVTCGSRPAIQSAGAR
jgi:threonine aldolase